VGGDVDTVAAMAGTMMGARVGWSGLGQRLQSGAEDLNDQGEWGLTELASLGEVSSRTPGWTGSSGDRIVIEGRGRRAVERRGEV
jgi:hypothetical protein